MKEFRIGIYISFMTILIFCYFSVLSNLSRCFQLSATDIFVWISDEIIRSTIASKFFETSKIFNITPQLELPQEVHRVWRSFLRNPSNIIWIFTYNLWLSLHSPSLIYNSEIGSKIYEKRQWMSRNCEFENMLQYSICSNLQISFEVVILKS